MPNLGQMFNAGYEAFALCWCVLADALFKALEN